MAITANETHVYKTRTLARNAAQDNELDLDDLHVCRAGDPAAWGWVPLAHWEAECGVKVAESEFGPVIVNNEPAVAEVVKRPYVSMADPTAMPLYLPVPFPSAPVVVEPEADAGAYEPEPTTVPVPAFVDNSEGLLICDVELPSFDAAGDVFIQIGPMLPYAAKSDAMAMAKRYQSDVQLTDAAGNVLMVIGPKGKKAPTEKPTKPQRTAMGESIDDEGKPQRPPINSTAHKSCEKLLDKIEDASGDLNALLSMVGTQGFKGGYTYGNIVMRYLNAHIVYARTHENDNVPGEEILQDAAD